MPCNNWKCCDEYTKKIISLKEKKSQFILKNPHKEKIGEIRYDECPAYGHYGEKRCDYILTHSEITIFIELKGKNFEKAISQLQKSINNTKNNCYGKKYAFIVASKFPSATSSSANYKKIFRKQYNTMLEYQSREMTQSLDKLLL